MKRPLFEIPEFGPASIAAGSLGEDEDALFVRQHFGRGAGESLAGGLAVGAIDEDGAAEGHEPSQKGDAFERGFGGDGTVGWEDAGEEEDVEFGLVVAHDDAGAGIGEVVFAGDDVARYTGCVAHCEGEGAGGEVLG